MITPEEKNLASGRRNSLSGSQLKENFKEGEIGMF